MTKKIVLVLCLFLGLVGVICFEQIYTENSINEIFAEIDILQTNIEKEDLEASKKKAEYIVEFWGEREGVICLFVDYRDIEQITKQANLVVSHLSNKDFQLARVECNALSQAVENFYNMVKFDFWNIF
ncbi:MAG: DUF4363 family protein [Clostridia bacterium]|nr:DUF4363 family protein [Clostridia bacterium]